MVLYLQGRVMGGSAEEDLDHSFVHCSLKFMGFFILKVGVSYGMVPLPCIRWFGSPNLMTENFCGLILFFASFWFWELGSWKEKTTMIFKDRDRGVKKVLNHIF